ncbi:MAG: DUF2752 domain-containing protein [Eubacteriales bacterium]|nr:DUF2752 domain-containing protein [Eubacteriales bacterium]MDD4323587.1 DUF2752 domain-containing protein [Eubacteriales bacterium]MDD4541613.1 DUF2752 domain-containing protein [Eubacteriales bacterium]
MSRGCEVEEETQKVHRDKRPARSWLLPVILGLALLSFAMEYFGSGCAVSSVIGFPCPGCGSSRAAVLLFQGRLGEALRMHPLIILSLLMLLVILSTEFIKFIRRKQGKAWNNPIPQRLLDVVAVAIIALYLGVYVYRMIKYYPHTEPMIYNWNSVWGQIARLFMRIFA